MCARFQFTPPEDWLEEFGLTDGPEVAARYNIAPTQPVVAVRCAQARRREAGLLRWGLVPSWAEDLSVGHRLINARAETLAAKPAFAEAFRFRRCLVPATGFYEWRRSGTAHDPFLVRLRGGAPFAFAGIWERWDPSAPTARQSALPAARGGSAAAAVESCALITTEANPLVAPIHDRMPVILDRRTYGAWLDPDADEAALRRLLTPYSADAMETLAVSTHVNSPAVDDPECARPIDPASRPGQLTLW